MRVPSSLARLLGGPNVYIIHIHTNNKRRECVCVCVFVRETF